MKAHFLETVLGAALMTGAAHGAFAQPPPPEPAPALQRADTWAAFGWHHTTISDVFTYGDRINRAVGTVGGGWYWSPRLKMELDVGTPVRTTFYQVQPTVVGNITTSRYTRVAERSWTLAAVQVVEFLPNAWFTPYVGAGVGSTNRTREAYVESVFLFDPVTRRPIEAEHEEHRTVLRPVAAIGFKAYVSRRAFFRADTRLTFQSGVEHSLVRFGFGVDF